MVPNNSDIVKQARNYLGVKWHHQGRNPKTGLDCLGLVSVVLKDLGVPVNDVTSYSRDPDPDQMLKGLLDHAEEIAIGDAVPGCVYWMRFVREPQHLAIVSDVGIIHSYNKLRSCVVEHALNRAWKARIVRAFKIKGVIYE